MTRAIASALNTSSLYKGESFLEIHQPQKFIKTNLSIEEIEPAKDPSDEGREINEVFDLIIGE